MKSTKAFSLMEIITIIAIISILSAMAIPAFTKVRNASILKTYDDSGTKNLSEAQKSLLYDLLEKRKVENKKKREEAGLYVPEGGHSAFADMLAKGGNFESFKFEGKNYFLIPQDGSIDTMVINNKKYFLFPDNR